VIGTGCVCVCVLSLDIVRHTQAVQTGDSADAAQRILAQAGRKVPPKGEQR
jgi:hypothetical protein